MSVLESAGLISAQTTLMLPPASRAMTGWEEKPELLEMFFGPEKLTPPSVERPRKISKLPGLSLAQTTLRWPARSTAIRGLLELARALPRGFERFNGSEKFAPLSAERLKEMSECPAVSSSQTTLMAPFLSTAICGSIEPPVLVESIFGAENVAPPLLEPLNQAARLPVSLSQTTLMLAACTAICGME